MINLYGVPVAFTQHPDDKSLYVCDHCKHRLIYGQPDDLLRLDFHERRCPKRPEAQTVKDAFFEGFDNAERTFKEFHAKRAAAAFVRGAEAMREKILALSKGGGMVVALEQAIRELSLPEDRG